MSAYDAIFLKEDSSLDMKLEILKGLSHTNKEELYMLERGVKGEKEVLYYLKKSGMGMYAMRDINLTCDDLKAQVDFIVVTSHHCYFIECKNYSADIIHIDETGNFDISTRYKNKYIRKGIKSPLSQTDDQLSVFKKICLNNQEKVKVLLSNNRFEDYFKTMVVFTNPENRINNKKAPSDIKYRVLKVDNLVRQIEYDKNHFNGNSLTREQMKDIADFILDKNVAIEVDKKIISEDLVINEQPELKSSNKKEDTITSSLLKEAKTGMTNIIKTIIGCFILIVIASLLTKGLQYYYGNNKTQDGSISNSSEEVPNKNENKLTNDQISALNTFKTAYTNSQQNGFDIIDTSICKEISGLIDNKLLCDRNPLHINITDNKVSIYKPFYCYKMELGKEGNSLINAYQESGFVYSSDKCFDGSEVLLGVLEMDESNDYCKKIGGLQKIKEMATYSVINDALLDNYYDSSHIIERGGNERLYSTYKSKVNMYFSSLTGKSYGGMALNNTYKENTNEMCESLYYIMK